MSYKAIFTGVSGGAAAAGTVELAAHLAHHFGAAIEGLHVRLDPVRVMASSFDGAFGLPLPMSWVDDLGREVASTAAAAKEMFSAGMARRQISFADMSSARCSAAWRAKTGDAASLLSSRSRFFDLTVLGRSERVAGNPYSSVIEAVLCNSGRPALLAPKVVPSTLATKVGIGWNGSAQSVKALAAAMPLLQISGAATIWTIEADEKMGIGSLIDYLKLHGVAATYRSLQAAENVDLGDQLIEAANDVGTDLLVLGGYGHLPWRDTLFGGVTRSVLRSSLFPVLLAH